MHTFRKLVIATGSLLLVAAAGIAYSNYSTESDIDNHVARVTEIAFRHPSRTLDGSAMADLPPPVQAYFGYVFPETIVPRNVVGLRMEGQFRRPLTTDFGYTTAEQAIAVATPALVFSATTTIVPGIWARAYDAFAGGKMEMKAKVMSTLTVVDEHETEELNRASLRRWLLESPLYPMALLPGGPVRWEHMDATHARAVVTADGLTASLVATFAPNGSLVRFDAEHDGDLTTPYHGSGEHAARSDYRLVQGMMIPHQFVIARAAGGRLMPFWKGKLTSIRFDSPEHIPSPSS